MNLELMCEHELILDHIALLFSLIWHFWNQWGSCKVLSFQNNTW